MPRRTLIQSTVSGQSTNMKSVIKGLGLQDVHRDKDSPVLRASQLSKLTLWWINKHVWDGFRRPLAPHDIHTVPPDDKSVNRALRIGRYWDELTPEQQRRPNALLKATIQSNWQLLATSIVFILMSEICRFTYPFLISIIVDYHKKADTLAHEAWLAAGIMILLMLIYAVFSTQGEYLGQLLAMRMRSSCSAILTRKATRLSSKGLSQLSSGMINNLLATDVEKFYNAASEFKGLFVGPVVLVSLFVLMTIELGLKIIPALIFVIILTAVRFIMGNVTSKLRLEWASWSDKRITQISEVVTSMQVIKANCAEGLVDRDLKEIRKNEIKKAGLTMFLNGLNLNLGIICDRVVTFLVVLTIILSGDVADYKTTIQVLIWMKMGKLGFMSFPIGYSMWKQMEASLSRIQDFLLGEEFMGVAKMLKESKVGKDEIVHIQMVKASASWSVKKKNESELEKMMKSTLLKSISAMSSVASDDTGFIPSGTFSLRNISLYLNSTDKVGVIGRTGSGKTSLILSILGNLPLGGGTRTVKGRIAYVPQKPWIRADSVRNNILMGERMYRDKYTAVLKAAALQRDIAAMDDGDNTMVGDNGSSLSGGQRARISLARALYREADIYILDDPSSALDTKVTNHIFTECFNGILKDKLVILATNDCSLLQYTNWLIALNDGRVLAQGTMEEVAKKIKVNDFLAEPTQNLTNDEELADVFEKQDKAQMLMTLLGNTHMKKEHAHVPTKRSTPFAIYIKYWLAGLGYLTMSLFSLLLLAQQVFSVVGEWWLVYKMTGGKKKKSYNKKGDFGYDNGYGDSKYNQTSKDAYNYTSSSIDPVSIISEITQNLFSTTTMTSPTPQISNFTSTAGMANMSTTTMYPDFIVKQANETEINFAAAAGAYASKDIDQKALLWEYVLFTCLTVVTGVLAVCAGTAFMVLAAKNIYNKMFYKILTAPIENFTKDKAGEMINRFARDTGRMDDIIPITINYTFVTAAIIMTHAVYICIMNFYVIVASIPYFFVVVLFILFSVRSIRDTKRLESEFRTPSFEHLQHLLSGLEVIRAFGMENFVIREADSYLDRHTSAWFLYVGSMYWMKMRLNLLVTVYMAGVLVISFLTSQGDNMGSAIGLSLTYILVIMARVQYCAMYSAMLDANMTSVEHITEYDHLDEEDRRDTESPTKLILPPAWPDNGSIKFCNVNIIYPGAKHNTLANLSITIKGGEKVGIVGRTGAGKSTLFNILLRLYTYTGKVTIDECNIKAMGLDDLRCGLTFLSQEAVLHSGTLRENLDPFHNYSDRHIWLALDKVGLKHKVIQLPGHLNTEIEVNGRNFSAGQKQLLCMVKALLNMRKIMLLDEITANVDIETARTIDRVLTENFKDCTIVSVSHDMERIINFDRILVMSGGCVAQFDHPHILLQDTEGPFYSLVKHCGPHRLQQLSELAERSYRERVELTA